MRKKDLDIAQNLKIVEWLKAELLDSVADLFKSLLKTGSDTTNNALATIIIITYLLGRRVGVSFESIDNRLREKLDISIREAQGVEQWNDDLTELLNYLEKKR
ncbi:MAG: MazG-like family protein [Syntrophomonadaceae bacterium]